MLHFGDIKKLSGYTVPVVDCVVGGSPCQDLSVAGKRAGLDGERSGLFMEQIRIIKEMRDRDVRENGRSDVDVRPRYMVWENVPGAFSKHKGEDFRIILEKTAKIADKSAVIPRPDKGKWTTSGCILGDGWSIAWRVLDAQFWGVPQRRRRIALVADFGGQSAPEILFIRKSLSGDIEPCETQRKAYRPLFERSAGEYDRERNHITQGNRWSIGFDGYNHSLTGNVAATLGVNCGLASGRNGVLVFENHSQDSRYKRLGDVSETVSAKYGTGGNNQPLVVHCAAVDCRNFTENQYINGTLQAKESSGSSLNLNNVVRTGRFVRRLTPLECERLQGYPDGWTDIVEWTDSKGRKRKSTDSARYKALGNSIAIPPWKFVMKRLCACYERDATLASLFDGIGGFPYIWEQINGKGSCLWASEIEKFPIAVTKIRIGE